jgi:hypothetical protein
MTASTFGEYGKAACSSYVAFGDDNLRKVISLTKRRASN